MPLREDKTSAQWVAPQWKAVVRLKEEVWELPQSKPWARLGSDKRCEICLEGPSVPLFAYFICVFRDAVEVWPLSSVAMAQSGPINPEDNRLAVGIYRVSVQLSSAAQQRKMTKEPPIVEISGLDQRWRTTLKRPVTIVGSDHPSIIRIREADLNTCHGVFVSEGTQLWYVDLLVERESPMSIRRVEIEESLDLGKLQLQRLPSLAKPDSVQPVPENTAKQGVSGNEVPVEAYAENYTSDVSHRMFRMGKQRAFKRRVAALVAASCGVAFAIAVTYFLYLIITDQLTLLNPA